MTKLLKNKAIIIFAIIILIVFVLIGPLKIQDKILKTIYPKKYSEIISKYCTQYNVDENLIYAIIKAESNFEETAKSNKNAKGLMQLMEETAKDIAKKTNVELKEETIEKKLLDPEISINLGTKYISILIEKYQNKEIALAAYNAGIGTVNNWIEKGIIKSDGSDIENIPYKETNLYVRKIMRDYEIYNNLYKY